MPTEIPAGKPFFIAAAEGSLTWDASELTGSDDANAGGYVFTAAEGMIGEATISYTDANGAETPLTVSIGKSGTPLAAGPNGGQGDQGGSPWQTALAVTAVIAAAAIAAIGAAVSVRKRARRTGKSA
jgi:hypothetical protein